MITLQNLYGELTFTCPAYWIAEAYTGDDRTAYKYQYSVIPGIHGADEAGYFGPLGKTPYLGINFQRAFMQIWGNFVTQSNPSISASVAAGALSNGTAAPNPITQWPAFTVEEPNQISLNQTGGVRDVSAAIFPLNATYFKEPGLVNDFTLGDAYAWEAGRGLRCDFWRSVADIIPA